MYQFQEHITPEKHDAFHLSCETHNLLQTSQWANIKQNWDHQIVGVEQDGKLVASCLVLIKHLPMNFTVMYIPRGPICDFHNSELVTYFLTSLKKWAKKKHCIYIKMDPSIHLADYHLDNRTQPNMELANQVISDFAKVGAKHTGFTTFIEESAQPRFQAGVDLTTDLDQALPRHTLRLIKDALKYQVQIVQKQDVKDFADIIKYTEQRKNINLRDESYFQTMLDTYQDDCYIFLAQVDIPSLLKQKQQAYQENQNELQLLAENQVKKQRKLNDIKNALEKEIPMLEGFLEKYPSVTTIAGVLSIKAGDTLEMLYAGMNEDFKKFMPQYYLYTTIMKYAQQHGCTFANMGGVEGDFKDGLTQFKSNFDPIITEFIGEFDMPIYPMLYHLGNLALKLKRKLKNK